MKQNGLTWSDRLPDKVEISANELVARSHQEARLLLSLELARRYFVLPLKLEVGRGRRSLTCGVSQLPSVAVQAELRFVCEADLTFVLFDRSVLGKAIELAYQCPERNLLSIAKELQDNRLDEISGVRVTQFVDSLMRYAFELNASDVHVIPNKSGTSIQLRVDGQVLTHEQPLQGPKLHQSLVRRLKVLGGLDPLDEGVVVDSEFQVKLGLYEYSVRLASMPTYWGDRVSLRLHSWEHQAIVLSKLNFPRDFETAIGLFCRSRPKLALVMGPTGSGKTTTLYSMLDLFRQLDKHIISIEDPVEFPMAGISQSQVSPREGNDYEALLKASLRHDPDVIMLGEIRDEKVATGLIHAALSGHHVLSTVHGSSLFHGLQRICDLSTVGVGVLQEILGLIVYQELLPLLCSRCKVPQSNGTWSAVGCDLCQHSGQRGLIPVLEYAYGFGSGQQVVYENSNAKLFAKFYCSLRQSAEVLIARGLVSPLILEKLQ